VLTALAPATVTGQRVTAAEVRIRLKNGTELRGVMTDLETIIAGRKSKKADPDAIAYFPIIMVTNPLKRSFVPVKQQAEVNKEVALSGHEGFVIPQKKMSGGGTEIMSVQGYVGKIEPFNSAGQRTVKLRMEKGDTEVRQGVTRIKPDQIEIIGLNFSWKTAIATSSVPTEILDPMIRHVTKQDNPDDRLKIARFYILAGRYEPAKRELEAIREKFPKLAETVDKVKIILAEAQSQEFLNELKLRRGAGQHQLVYELSKKFPVENAKPTVLREVRELTTDYDQALERAEKIVAQLGDLQGALKGDPRIKEIAPLRAEIAEKLNYSCLDRLDAYVKLSPDPKLKPEEKLALALSGWVVGSANAVTELDQALRLWQARFLVLDYLRTGSDGADRKPILDKLESLEGVGPERIAQMIPLLPPAADPAGAAAGRTVRIAVETAKDAPPAAYWVTLPFEYHLGRTYPLIVALHSEFGGAQQEVEGFWGGPEGQGGQAHRHGYIVIAPEYIEKGNVKGYDYGARSHQIVLESLRDACQRFAVDSDRVFLAGHGMGGDAVWDMGLAHPHLFAGLVPITGAIDRQAKYYLENGKTVPVYAISGEFDRDLFGRSALSLEKMLKTNFDLIYTEYKGAGPEPFFSEIHSIFDWMSRCKRPAPPKEVEAKVLRETDNRFYWLEFSGVPERFTTVDWTNEKQAAVKPFPASASISAGNTVRVKAQGTAHQRLWVPRGPEVVDFDKKVNVEINGRNRFSAFLKPDTAAMLEHVRLTGDHQQLYWAMLDF
jgi:tetratricopeptide (TPR) repeat protein